MKFLDNDDKAENNFLFLALFCSLIIIIKKKNIWFQQQEDLAAHFDFTSFLF